MTETVVETSLSPTPAASTAIDMARRVLAVAEELQKVGIKPHRLSVGLGYMVDKTRVDDMVSVQLDGEKFVTVAAWAGFDHSELERNAADEVVGLAYASGWLHGIAVQFYANGADVFDAERAS